MEQQPFNKLLSNAQLIPNLSKDTFEPRSERGPQEFIQSISPLFITRLPGCSAQTRPAGHRRCRPPRTSCEHSWQHVILRQYGGTRFRSRPPRLAFLLTWSYRQLSEP